MQCLLILLDNDMFVRIVTDPGNSLYMFILMVQALFLVIKSSRRRGEEGLYHSAVLYMMLYKTKFALAKTFANVSYFVL